MRKDKSTIINNIVSNAADIMEAKVEYLETVASMFEGKNETQQAAFWRQDIETINQAVAVMRKNEGCWD